MAKRIILGGLLGGILLFNWGYVAHMVLPIGEMACHQIPDEATVIGSIRSSIKEPGFYLFPGMDMSKHPSESEIQAWQEKAKQGPVGVVIVRPQGGDHGGDLGRGLRQARDPLVERGPEPLGQPLGRHDVVRVQFDMIINHRIDIDLCNGRAVDQVFDRDKHRVHEHGVIG